MLHLKFVTSFASFVNNSIDVGISSDAKIVRKQAAETIAVLLTRFPFIHYFFPKRAFEKEKELRFLVDIFTKPCPLSEIANEIMFHISRAQVGVRTLLERLLYEDL